MHDKKHTRMMSQYMMLVEQSLMPLRQIYGTLSCPSKTLLEAVLKKLIVFNHLIKHLLPSAPVDCISLHADRYRQLAKKHPVLESLDEPPVFPTKVLPIEIPQAYLAVWHWNRNLLYLPGDPLSWRQHQAYPVKRTAATKTAAQWLEHLLELASEPLAADGLPNADSGIGDNPKVDGDNNSPTT